jgi:D-mannonate dehydratase
MSRIAGLERVLEFISDARSMQDFVKNAYNRITV